MLTYKKAAEDIVNMSSAITEENTARVARQTKMFGDALAGMVDAEGGWMLLTAFTVALTELRKVQANADPADALLIQQVMLHVLGGFGKQLN